MSVAVEKRIESSKAGGRLFDPGGELSLDESVSAVWESLVLRGEAHCLVCGASLVRVAADRAECTGCGSHLE